MTETNPPPHPSCTGTASPGDAARERATTRDGASAPDPQTKRQARILDALSLDTEGLEQLAAACRRLRQDLRRPAALWTADRLADVLAVAVLDAGWPASTAVQALLTVAADPVTRSPARLSCPGPWWDDAAASGLAATAPGEGDDVAVLEAVLAETGGLRVALQRRARDELTTEGLPVTRATVARRAIHLLHAQEAAHGGVTGSSP